MSFPPLRGELLVIAKIVLDGLGMSDVGRVGPMEEVDLHRLILRYSTSRIRRPRDLHRLTDSIGRHGQGTPVVTVAGEGGKLILIDGYLRVEAVRRCGKDTVLADLWPYKEDEALARVLSRSQERPWEAIEQAALIAELRGRFGWSLGQIARKLGRDLSWVSRRVALMEALPDEILDGLCQGKISSWTACRVLAPLARANPEHAQLLGRHLISEPLSTREVAELYGHYQQGNAKHRQRIVQEPALFIKAMRARKEQLEAQALTEGPEGQWIKDWRVVTAILRRLHKALPTVIYAGQGALERRRLLRAFGDAKGVLEAMENDIRRIDEDHLSQSPRSDPGDERQGGGTPSDQPPAQCLPQYGQAGAPGAEGAQEGYWDPPQRAGYFGCARALSPMPG
jgi:ParB-like chromosome segregation protein Spo0J